MAEDLLDAKSHFAFGKNWKSFLTVLDEERVAEAEKGLARLLPADELRDRSFCDIGCGSGLSSLAAAKLDVSSVAAFDIDKNSVEATQGLLGKYLPKGNWSAAVKSVFDLDPARDGQFDIVYSWGVLHHTGDMWRAVEKAASLVKPGGVFVLALYRKTALCDFWEREKRYYSKAGRLTQWFMATSFKAFWIALTLKAGKNPFSEIRNYKSGRGMNWSHDIHDWLGGYPYESALPSEVRARLSDMGFIVVREFVTKPGRGLLGSGCDEFVARKA